MPGVTNDDQRTPRRTVLCGAALAALGLTASACSGSSESGSSDSSDSSGSGGEGASQDGGKAPESGGGESVSLGAASAIPVGGAKVFAKQKLLVSQPKKDEFKAFSAICTHQGSLLDSVEKDQAVCPLHGSRFQTDTGEPSKGPATAPLPEVPVSVGEDGTLIAKPKGSS